MELRLEKKGLKFAVRGVLAILSTKCVAIENRKLRSIRPLHSIHPEVHIPLPFIAPKRPPHSVGDWVVEKDKQTDGCQWRARIARARVAITVRREGKGPHLGFNYSSYLDTLLASVRDSCNT